MNLEIGGTRIRVSCTRGIARKLRAALREHLIDEDAPLGFVVRPTSLRTRRHTLVDRCGFVLGSSSKAEEIVTMLGAHLSALVPPADGVCRIRVRALGGAEGWTLCAYPALFVPPIDEARLTDIGLTLLDRLAVDLDVATGQMVNPEVPWPALARSSADGHVAPTGNADRVARLLVLQDGQTAPPSRSEMIALLSRERLAGSRADVLAACSRLAGAADLISADPGSPSEMYERLAPDRDR